MRPARIAGVVLALLLLAGSLFLSVGRLFGPSPRWFVLAAALSPYALIGYAVALALLLLVRRSGRWVFAGAAVAVVGLALHMAWLAPLYAGSHPSGPVGLRIMTSNLRLGQGDAREAMAVATREHADLVVLEEVTPALWGRLMAQPGSGRWTYHAGTPLPGPQGTVVLSRYPLSDVQMLPIHNGAFRVQVAAPAPFTLLAVHTSEPLRNAPGWRQNQAAILSAVRAALKDRRPLIVAGDFNTTTDERPMRKLLGLGLHDAARQANSGWQPTWPSSDGVKFGLPFGMSLITIDHVLTTAPYAAVDTHTFRIGGTDHRALVVGLS